jgi:hypothetical protein
MVDIVWLFLFLFVYLWGSGDYNLDIIFDTIKNEDIIELS